MTDTCQCKQPNIKTLSFGHESESGVNKLCLTCGTHWYGPDGEVKRFTRKEWDQLMNSVESNPAEPVRTCQTCAHGTKMDLLNVFCDRRNTSMSYGWNRKTSTCEEHDFRAEEMV